MTITVQVMANGTHRMLPSLEGLGELLQSNDATVWIDADEQTPAVHNLLCDTLGLHPLTIEDIFSDRMTPKIEEYPNFLYIVVHGVRTDSEHHDAMSTLEIDVVIGTNWVFTHHVLPMAPLESLKTDLARNPRALGRGVAFLAHAVIDRLVDCYIPVVDKIDGDLEDLEKHIVEDPTPALMARAFEMKRGVQQLRRTAVYQREILHRLSRGEFEQIPENALPFYRDVYDQFVRVSDLVDSYRDLLSSMIEIYMSVTANRTNEIMKALALISTIMLPLTFIAGVYGMNFEHMPELKWKYGYLFALGMMSIVAGLLYYWFKRRRWL